jgi:nucleoside-diphosphate-sugar epimerase
MSERCFLVTGAFGCIGAMVVAQLAAEGAAVVALDRAADDGRLRLALADADTGRVTRESTDITEAGAVASVLDEHAVTHVIHLAALQVPACAADPPLGALVNVVGTARVFEAVRGRPAARNPVVYASSVAAYGADEDGSAPDPTGHPQSHYGVYKRANEDAARVEAAAGVSSIGLRPYVVYGLGRDTGLTSSPTFAMLAAAAGRPFHIRFGGRSQLQHVRDVAAAFIAASESGRAGAAVANLPAPSVHMREVVAAIEAAAPASAGTISFEDVQLPFPPEIDSSRLRDLLPGVPETPLHDGVRDTIERFRELIGSGRIDPERLLARAG